MHHLIRKAIRRASHDPLQGNNRSSPIIKCHIWGLSGEKKQYKHGKDRDNDHASAQITTRQCTAQVHRPALKCYLQKKDGSTGFCVDYLVLMQSQS